MGHLTRDIAIVTDPKQYSLSGTPNFLVIAKKPSRQEVFSAYISIKSTSDVTALRLAVIDGNGVRREFNATTSKAYVNGSTFLAASSSEDTLENLRVTLLGDSWIATNFSVVIPTKETGGKMVNGDTMYINGKGGGTSYDMTLQTPNDTTHTAYGINILSPESSGNDSISGEASTAEISVDVYTGVGGGPGSDIAVGAMAMHTLAITLQKTYAGGPVWFDVNRIFSDAGRGLPASSGWSKPGTLKDYMLVARVGTSDSRVFYQSAVNYVVEGYGDVDLKEYLYLSEPVKQLTRRPRLRYLYGQRAYLNLFASRPAGDVRVGYDVLNEYGEKMGRVYGLEVSRWGLDSVNTCTLDIDSVLDVYPDACVVRVAVFLGDTAITEWLDYEVLPEGIHTLNGFSFLNSLGGWDSFNFDAPSKTDVKTEASLYDVAITPYNATPQFVRSVELSETYTVESAPVADEVALWLRELARSRLVLDGEGLPVVIEEFALSVSEAAKNMQRITMKYRYPHE